MKRKLIMYALVFLLVAFLAMFVYRYAFEFNNSKVKAYIKDEADQYNANAESVAYILHQSVEHILKSSELTAMVRGYSKKTGLEKERVLVDMAIAQAQSFKYIK